MFKRYPEELRKLIATKLAKLFIDGNTKADCVRFVFPKMSRNSARTNAPFIFRRYNVIERVMELFPDKLGDKDCERLLNYLKGKAFERGDDNLILQIVDRIAKLQGKFTEKFQVETKSLEEEEFRLKEATIVLARAGIDQSKINLN